MGNMEPLVSICIPTYRQTHLLEENLRSIQHQTYRNIEVLISDDSPDLEVEALVQLFQDKLPIAYWRNQPALGSPVNWNAVLEKAAGEYVVLLHHDDQFAAEDSLAEFLKPLQQDPQLYFSFGRNEGVEELTLGKSASANFFNRYLINPSLLITGNVIGAPSNVCLRREQSWRYDERFTWIVDVEFYTRLIRAGKGFVYIDKYLVKTGRHELQVTHLCLTDSNVLLYENITYAIEQVRLPKSIRIFDFYWRLLRNNGVRSVGQLTLAGINPDAVPAFIQTIIKIQRRYPSKVLKLGPVSKLLMACAYISSK